MKKRKTLKTLIIVMLILVVAAVAWILHLGKAANTAREPEQAQNEQASQETAQEEEQKKEEEQSAMKKSTEEKLAASHVYSYRGTEGPEEHSFKAYDAAIDAGSQYIGVDVVISSDGVLYVSSELNAYTMTDYNGMYEYISSETVDGLKTAAGNKILRLSEVFEHYGKDINYVIEIKDNSDKCLLAFEKLVDDTGLSDVITAASMKADTLDILDKKYPDMPKLLVCWNQGDFDYALDQSYIDTISVRATVETGILTESNCKAAHDAGKKFGAWTINTEDEIKKAIDMGVDNYFTNDTPLALSVEKDYGLKVRKDSNEE
ncbi:MAG: glycerophosphodiester phosphodiesterase [Mogibacterium sp.]|nr:glycerophosphodiester phosphodiesterase [Mogibacterium sp.]